MGLRLGAQGPFSRWLNHGRTRTASKPVHQRSGTLCRSLCSRWTTRESRGPLDCSDGRVLHDWCLAGMGIARWRRPVRRVRRWPTRNEGLLPALGLAPRRATLRSTATARADVGGHAFGIFCPACSPKRLWPQGVFKPGDENLSSSNPLHAGCGSFCAVNLPVRCRPPAPWPPRWQCHGPRPREIRPRLGPRPLERPAANPGPVA